MSQLTSAGDIILDTFRDAVRLNCELKDALKKILDLRVRLALIESERDHFKALAKKNKEFQHD
jgi:hypothetical protein